MKKKNYWESPQVFNFQITAIVHFVVEADDSPAQPYEALCFHLSYFHL